DENVFKMQNMGISAGHVNAFDYCVSMMGFPSHAQLLEGFLQEPDVKERFPMEAVAQDARRI
ncbi:hypothetical protein ACXWOC_09960, partial [Streptococcus pyogenes]